MRSLSVVVVLALCGLAAASVQHLTPSNFDSVVGQDKPALVEFFAPWCGHCKALAPTYDDLGNTYANQAVVIASVDADQHRELGQRFGVSGFPTIKWFPAGSTTAEDYQGGRSLEDFVDFINRKTGLSAKIKKEPSAVVDLTDSNFDSIVLDENKHVLVEFFAPWCGHCKRLAPDYEKVGASFAGEDEVVIAKLDADKYREPATKYGVTGYPTLMFFPKDKKEGEKYESGRSPSDFVDFINKRAGTERTVGGGFSEKAGRIPELDKLAQKFVDDEDSRQDILNQAETVVDSSSHHKNAAFAKFYTTTMQKALADSSYAKKEVDRLERMLKGNIKAADAAKFHKRINIVKQFL